MRVVLGLARDSLVSALASYGFIALMAAFLPALGSIAFLWPLVPVTFALQFGLKLVFSRDPSGRLIRVR